MAKSKTEKYGSKIINFIIKTQLAKGELFVTQKVGDILWYSYKDDLTKRLATIENLLEFLHIKIDRPPSISKDGHFSLLASKNDSDNGLWSINTGKSLLKSLDFKVVF